MKPLEKAKSLKDQIYEIIKEDILNQKYENDVVLNERKISQALNVSKTPVREALKALESEGWVEYVPYKGVLVKQMSLADMKNVFRIRKALEVLMIEMAMERMSPSVVAELHESYRQQKRLLEKNQPVVAEFIDYDMEFHGILVKATGSKLLTDLILQMRDKSKCFGVQAIFSNRSRYEETITEHERIYEAVAEGDIEKAKEAMAYHMDKTYEAAIYFIQKEHK